MPTDCRAIRGIYQNDCVNAAILFYDSERLRCRVTMSELRLYRVLGFCTLDERLISDILAGYIEITCLAKFAVVKNAAGS